MTSSTPEAPEPGTQVDVQRLAICDLNKLVDSLIAHERHAFAEYRDRGHSYFEHPQSQKRWEATNVRLTEVVRFCQTIPLARQSPTVALTNDRDEER